MTINLGMIVTVGCGYRFVGNTGMITDLGAM